MTQNTDAFSRASGGAGAQPSTSGIAREETANVGRSVRDASGQVAETAGEQARQVVSETGRQARDLVGQTREQARKQASAQQQRAVEQLRTLAGELHDMAAKGGTSGMAADIAQEASSRIHGVASWLEQREPGDLLSEVSGFARRRPGAFLLGAALAGVVAGRLTRGVTAATGSGRQPGQPYHASERMAPAPGAPPAVGVTPGTSTVAGVAPGTSATAGPASAQVPAGYGDAGRPAGGEESGESATGYPSYRPGRP